MRYQVLVVALGRELAFGVVLFEEILDNSSRFPEDKVIVLVIDQDRYTSVDVQLESLISFVSYYMEKREGNDGVEL